MYGNIVVITVSKGKYYKISSVTKPLIINYILTTVCLTDIMVILLAIDVYLLLLDVCLYLFIRLTFRRLVFIMNYLFRIFIDISPN